MVSASKAARDAKRAEAGKAPKKTLAQKKAEREAEKSGTSTPLIDADGQELDADGVKAMEKIKKLELQEDAEGISDRVTTGVLASQEASRDVKITSASLVFHGKVLFNDTTLEVNYGRRYGLLGENGCGKSTLLKAINAREFPFPDHIDIYLLNEGAPLTDLGALEWVVRQAEEELARLERLVESILEENGPEDPRLEEIYEVRSSRFPKGIVHRLTQRSAWTAWTPRPSRPVHP